MFDQTGQGISGIKVQIPDLQLEGETDSKGTLMLGGSLPASQAVVTGLYSVLLNPGQSNPGYGTRDLKVQITAGQVNTLIGLRLHKLSPQVAYRFLESGTQTNVLVGGDLEINTQNARLVFPNGQAVGQVHVQIADFNDGLYSTGAIELTPLWMFNLQPGPIEVRGEVALKIRMPTLYGSHDYVPDTGTFVVLMGLDDANGLIEPIGVGKINGVQIQSEGRLIANRLDFLGYQFLTPEQQSLAAQYAAAEIDLEGLRQGLLTP